MGKVEAIRFEGYKSFVDGHQEEISINPYISIFIGKNNSGKSSCIDAIERVFNPKAFNRGKAFTKISASFTLNERMIESGFSSSRGGGDIPYGGSHYSYGIKFFGKKIYVDLGGLNRNVSSVALSNYQPDLKLPVGEREWESVIRAIADFQQKYAFRRINAERDIIPENESADEVVDFGGLGATNILRKFINHSEYDEELIEVKLLEELNKIMEPDSYFKNIRIQQIESNGGLKWEIFLDEGNGRRFALSKSGSGLKTIILMLINLYVLPRTKEYKDKEFIYAFEELENNLHPALQRKVFEYLYKFAAENKVHIFITTHSHVAINTFFEKENIAIYHVQKRVNRSEINSVVDRETRLDVLSDLDVRASDLFQSNRIIWVEGPSDRVYINRWLKVFCDCDFIEGSDYQFLYYGGKVLSHYTTEENVEGLISILTTNQNSAIVIDSDKKSQSAKINETKRRIKKEFDQRKSFCWITKGKEVENYLSTDALRERFDSQIDDLNQYTLFPGYIEPHCKNFSKKKVKFAREIEPYITNENSQDILDLKKQINRLYECIKEWNKRD